MGEWVGVKRGEEKGEGLSPLKNSGTTTVSMITRLESL